MLTEADERLLRRRVKASLDAHCRRAAADRQQLGYTAADLEALVRAAERCCYCRAPLTVETFALETFALDHATPTCRTAAYTLGNLAVCCGPCNEVKGQLSAAEFGELLALLRTWHPRAQADVLGRLRAGGRRYAGQ